MSLYSTIRAFRKGRLTVARMNELVRAINAIASLAVDQTLRMTHTAGGVVLGVAPRESGIRFFNDSGEEVPAWGCMAVKSDTQTWAERDVSVIEKPSTTFRRNYLFNGALAVPDQTFGYAQSGPTVFALYGSGSPVTDDAMGPTPSEWYLTKGNPATGIVLALTNATDKIVEMTWHEILKALGKTTATVSKGSSGTINIYNDDTDTIITSLTVSAKNRWCSVSSGKWVTVGWTGTGATFEQGEQ